MNSLRLTLVSRLTNVGAVLPSTSVVQVRQWHKDAATAKQKPRPQVTTPRPVLTAREMNENKALPGEDFYNPTIKPPVPIVPHTFYDYVRPGKKKSPQVHHKPKITYDIDWRDVDLQTGGVYTHKPLKVRKLGGKHHTSRQKMNKHISLGYKWFDYFIVDIFRDGPEDGFYEERVLEVRRDPNRTAWIMQTAGERGRRWLINTHGIVAGDVIRTTKEIPPRPIIPKVGDTHPLGAMAPGTSVHSVEIFPGDGALYCNNAGTKWTVNRQTEKHTVLEAMGKRIKKELAVEKTCMATVGQCSNVEWKDKIWQSAYMHIRFGYKPRSGLWHRKDGWCGRKAHNDPPMITIDKGQTRFKETYNVTLTKQDTRAKFGTDNVHPMMYDRK